MSNLVPGNLLKQFPGLGQPASSRESPLLQLYSSHFKALPASQTVPGSEGLDG